MCNTAKKGQKRHSKRGPSGFHRLQQQAPTAGPLPPPPAGPSAPPDAGLNADKPMNDLMRTLRPTTSMRLLLISCTLPWGSTKPRKPLATIRRSKPQ